MKKKHEVNSSEDVSGDTRLISMAVKKTKTKREKQRQRDRKVEVGRDGKGERRRYRGEIERQTEKGTEG